MIFLNFASSPAALVFYLPGVCTHTDTEGKQRKDIVRNIFQKSEKNTIFSEHPVVYEGSIAHLCFNKANKQVFRAWTCYFPDYDCPTSQPTDGHEGSQGNYTCNKCSDVRRRQNKREDFVSLENALRKHVLQTPEIWRIRDKHPFPFPHLRDR